MYLSKKMKSKTNGLLDTSLDDNCSIDNENVAAKKPKNKKKKDKGLNPIELDTNYDAKIKTFETIHKEVNDQNLNDSVSNVRFKKKRKCKINPSADVSFENNYIIDHQNVTENTPKKKKKHDKKFNSIVLDTNFDENMKTLETTQVNDQNINDSVNNVNLSEKIKFKINSAADVSFENNYITDHQNVKENTFKKKKKHDKKFNSIELDTNYDENMKTLETTQVNDHNINDSVNNVNFSEKIKFKINPAADVSFENNYITDHLNVKENTPKKKKKHDKKFNSIELDTNFDENVKTLETTQVNDQNINDSVNNVNLSEKIKSKINPAADVSFENNYIIDHQNVTENTPKKKKKYDKQLNSIELDANETEINTTESTNKESDISIMDDTNVSMCNSKKSKHNLTNTSHIMKKSKKSSNNHSDSKNENNMALLSEIDNITTDPHILEKNSQLKVLLNSMESYDFLNSSTPIETNFKLKDLNLTEYLFHNNPSLKDHPNFECIHSNLSNKINSFINKKCEIFTESDVLLLKTVGKIILERILEKFADLQSIQYLDIELPPESRKNKIHFIENTLSHPPNEERMNIIKKLNPLVKLRVFNIDEDNSIREYWSNFQKEYNITNIQPFLSNGLEMTLYINKRKDFVRYISTGLPNRLLFSVYSRFNTLFNGFQDKIRFSKEEDQLIMKVGECDAIKNKWALVSLILNRSRLQLFRRHNTLKNQITNQKRMNIMWDNNKRQQLFTNILLETNTKNWKDLENMTIKKDTWIKIEKKLDGLITHEQAKSQWNYISTMLFCEKPIKMTTFKLNVLKLLLEINPKHWSDLNWKEITNTLYPGANSKLIVSTFHIWIKRIPPEIKKNVADTLDYLQKYQMDKLLSQISKGKDLEWPRLTVEDDNLLVEY